MVLGKNDSFEIIDKPQVGRCLRATRKIPPLEVILVEMVAVIGPHHSANPVCVQCLREHTGEYYCVDCNLPLCDDICRNDEEHIEECSELAQLAKLSKGTEHVLMNVLAFRIYKLKEKGIPIWKDIDELMDHSKERYQNVEEWKMFQINSVDILKQVLTNADDAILHKIIGIIATNAVGFNHKKAIVKGRGIYPTLSLASHNCVCNSRYSVNIDDFSVTLRARRLIEEGEEITISYLPTIFGVPKRKTHIEEEWYFQCRCTRCSDVTEFGTYVSALKCIHCNEGLILPENLDKDSLWRCRFCMNPFEADFIANFVQTLEDELYAISKSNPTIKELEGFVRTHIKDLHNKHYLNLIAQRNLIHVLTQEPKTNKEAQKKIFRLSKGVLSTITRIDPGYSEWMGRLMKSMYEAQLALLKIELQEKKIDKNTFLEKSEDIWNQMKEVEKCDILCTPCSI